MRGEFYLSLALLNWCDGDLSRMNASKRELGSYLSNWYESECLQVLRATPHEPKFLRFSRCSSIEKAPPGHLKVAS